MSEPTKTIEVTGAIDTRKESLLEFPCDFPIKIMGKAHPEFKDTIFKVVAVHDNEIDVEKIVDGMRKKRSGGWKTPIGHIARLVGWNCPYCGRHAWRTQLAYPATITEQEARRLARLIRS